jgi:hypothetical protein
MKVSTGRVRIDANPRLNVRVFPEVREHVKQRVSHLSRRRECTAMPTVRPKSPSTEQQPVDEARNADDD